MDEEVRTNAVESPGPRALPARRPVNLRSVSLGLLGVIYLCALTPFNDSVVGNTFLVGNFLPTGILLFLGVVLVVINAPLRRWRPRWALGAGELSVALGMMLVAAAMPSSGLHRYLFPTMVSQYQRVADAPNQQQTLLDYQLPEWLLPEFQSDAAQERENIVARTTDPTIGEFYRRVANVEPGLANQAAAVPWWAWVRPALTWGALVAFIFGAFLFGAIIVRRQWVENERLAFPLAGVWTSLIEEPPPGRAFNATFASRAFWVAAVAVFVLHGWNAMHRYVPQSFPALPLSYNLWGEIFNQPPWSHVDWSMKAAAIYFSIVGIAFFLQLKVGFSLWFVFVAMNVVRMVVYTGGGTIVGGMEEDQSYGAAAAFLVAILWIGRRHWALVGRQMVRGRRPGEPAGRYLPYPVAGWGLTLCTIGIVAWLMLVGVSLLAALVLAIGSLLTFLLIARVVAETGLIFAQLRLPLSRVFLYLGETPIGRVPGFDYFMARTYEGTFTVDLRENGAVFALHALRVADQNAYPHETQPGGWRRTWPFVAALALAMGVGYLVGGASTLLVHYNHQARLDTQALSPIDMYAMHWLPQGIMDSAAKWERSGGVQENHSRGFHITLGAAMTGLTSYLRLRLGWWPLHPIGFLLLYTWPIRMIWFSLMLGWIGKALIVKYGGPPLMRAAKPFFLGLIVGEVAAAAFWLTVSLVLVTLGIDYEAIALLPG